MNRPKLIKMIMDYYKIHSHQCQEESFHETLKRIPDMDLWVLAKQWGLEPERAL